MVHISDSSIEENISLQKYPRDSSSRTRMQLILESAYIVSNLLWLVPKRTHEYVFYDLLFLPIVNHTFYTYTCMYICITINATSYKYLPDQVV